MEYARNHFPEIFKKIRLERPRTGSACYYFRTRRALLQATVERLAELDIAEVPALPQHDLGAFAQATAELLQRWLTTGRERQLARYELALEATRRPELRTVLAAVG